MAKEQTGLRLDPATLDRLVVVAGKLSERAGGATVTRAEAARVAVDRGLVALEVELGIRKEDKPTTKRARAK